MVMSIKDFRLVYGSEYCVSSGGGASLCRGHYYMIVQGDYDLVSTYEKQTDDDNSGYEEVTEHFVSGAPVFKSREEAWDWAYNFETVRSDDGDTWLTCAGEQINRYWNRLISGTQDSVGFPGF